MLPQYAQSVANVVHRRLVLALLYCITGALAPARFGEPFLVPPFGLHRGERIMPGCTPAIHQFHDPP